MEFISITKTSKKICIYCMRIKNDIDIKISPFIKNIILRILGYYKVAYLLKHIQFIYLQVIFQMRSVFEVHNVTDTFARYAGKT